MIRNSFVLLDKINKSAEKNIWSQGIKNWSEFILASKIKGISSRRKYYYSRKLEEALAALIHQDSEYFSYVLPSTETWRLYDYFRDETIFLDIELANRKGDIAVIGISDGVNTKTMVYGFNLDKKLLKEIFSHAKLLVTFNGSVFDVPAIKRYFDDIVPNIPHIDLRFCCKRLGLSGGLKEVEKKLNINRPGHLKGNPIDLWRAYHASGDIEYLQLLVQYNEEDVLNLKPIMEHCYKVLASSTRPLDRPGQDI